jgi:hypothetical protein
MKPRPVSKHERAEILAMLEVIAGTRGGSRLEELVNALVAAEQFWREAVSSLPETVDESDGVHYPECLLCKGAYVWTTVGETRRIEHTPDCPWKLAQE